jgi:hypothetical protein
MEQPSVQHYTVSSYEKMKGKKEFVYNGLKSLCLIINKQQKRDERKEKKKSIFMTIIWYAFTGFLILKTCAVVVFWEEKKFSLYLGYHKLL